jgi:hypothetical protein
VNHQDLERTLRLWLYHKHACLSVVIKIKKKPHTLCVIAFFLVMSVGLFSTDSSLENERWNYFKSDSSLSDYQTANQWGVLACLARICTLSSGLLQQLFVI